jgi:hypothetical protein
MFERGQDWTEKLRHLHDGINIRRESLVGELKAIDARWGTAKNSIPLGQLENLYRLFSYFDRWLAQIRERITRLLF